MTGGVDRIERAPAAGADWHLHDERELLQRSLADAAREHLAGDLTDEDYELLRARDERRLAALDAALASARTAPSDTPVPVGATRPRAGPGRRPLRWRWRRRWWMAAAGTLAVVAASAVLAAELTAPRLPGQDATGSISLNAAQRIERQLQQARSLAADGKAAAALQLYGDVLAEDPRQPVALAEWGWLDWRAARRAREQTVAAEGASALEEAVKVDPQLFAAQYYLGVVLAEEGAPKEAVAHFARFLADKPTSTWLHDAAPALRAAYAAAHEPLPAAVDGR